MNRTEAMRRLRAADPALHADPPVTAGYAFDLGETQTAAVPPQADHAAPVPRRPRRPLRRVAIVVAAAALATAIPLLWPGPTAPLSTALAVTRDGNQVHVTIPRMALFDVQKLRSALDMAGVRAVVMASSDSCPLPLPDGLMAGYDVAPPDLNLKFDPQVQHFTFLLDKMPAGTTLLFGVDRYSTGWQTMWVLVKHIPTCIPPWWDEGPKPTN